MYPFRKFTIGEMKNISKNTHKSVGVSIIYKHITSKYCEMIHKTLPRHVMPNTITWIGLISMLFSFFLTITFDLKLRSSSRLLSFLYAVSIIIYMTTDSLDGIHARKTDQCSALGKMLDHFVDSFAAFISLLSLCSSLKIGYGGFFMSLFTCIMFGFYIAEISERYTGILRFGSISGASEGLYIMIVVHLLVSINPDITLKYLSNPVIINQINKISYCITTIYVLYSLVDLFAFVKSASPKTPYSLIGKSGLKALSIISIFILPFKFAGFTPFSFSVLLIMFPQFFSINYLEEYICTMCGSTPDKRVFLYSLTIFSIQIMNLIYISSDPISAIILFVSSAHFLCRAGSVFINLSKNLNVKIFNSKY